MIHISITVDPNKIKEKTWIASEDYNCEDAPGQLNLVRGEELLELIPDKKGWTNVRNSKGEEGMVKTRYLGSFCQTNYYLYSTILVDRIVKVWNALQDYDCEEAPDQLNLVKGEVLEETVADKKGWTRVKNSKGEEGLVKTIYLGNNFCILPYLTLSF